MLCSFILLWKPYISAFFQDSLINRKKKKTFIGNRNLITSYNNAAEAELSKSSRTQITLVTVFSLCCHLVSASAAWWQKLRDLGGVSSPRPSDSLTQTRACEWSWAVRIPAPRSRGCSLHLSTTQSRSRPLRSIPLPAHLQFHPAPVKSLHARSHLKFLCMPNTCRFQPKPYAWDTLSAWRTWSGFCCVTAAEKSASLLFCRGAAVCGVFGPRTWYAHIPQAVWLL